MRAATPKPRRRGVLSTPRAPLRREPNTSPARLIALRILERVERTGAYANLALRASLERGALSPRDRAFATELAFGTLRWRGRLDFLLSHVLDHSIEKLEPPIASLLRLGAYQLFFTNSVPAAVAVSETVRLSKAAGVARASGLLNAVLRRLADSGADVPMPELALDPEGHLRHALSLPDWLAARWVQRFGATEAAALARAMNQIPPHTVRTNPCRGHRNTLLAELRERFPKARVCPLASDGITLGRGGSPAHDPAFLDGRFTIQDEASQAVVDLLAPRTGERILDACAAPGTKATAIAERVGAGGRVVGLDRHRGRLGLLVRDARRLGLRNLETLVDDASTPLRRDLAGQRFARILVDAPCSGIGTLRRHPDARWRIRPESLGRLARVQSALLTHVAPLLQPGGSLVYSTCSMAPEENEAVVSGFLERHKGFRVLSPERIPAPLRAVCGADGALRFFPHRHDTDGFYAVRLERVP